jgi:hypothetical protein
MLALVTTPSSLSFSASDTTTNSHLVHLGPIGRANIVQSHLLNPQLSQGNQLLQSSLGRLVYLQA